MSVSLCTQTLLCCLSIQVLNIKSLLPKLLKVSVTSVHSNLESRLVTMSVSLRTQTLLCCLSIQVLNIKSLLPKLLKVSVTSVHSNLEHGLAILTESFIPLKSELHNFPC